MRIIAGVWRGRRIEAPPGRRVRPTSNRLREAWMSAMGGRFPGRAVVDLFAGSGALGLECLSRGASSCVFVESDPRTLPTLRANIALLGAGEQAKVVGSRVEEWLADSDTLSFDIALADPPYGRGLAAALVARWLDAPFARELWVEHRSDETLPSAPGLRQRRYGDTTLTTLVSSA